MAEVVTIPEDVEQIPAPNILLISPDGSICNDQNIAFLLKQIIYQLSVLNASMNPVA